jgi:hypothetical protein
MKNQKSAGVRRVLLKRIFICAFLFSGCNKGYKILYEDDFSSHFPGYDHEGAESTTATSTTRSQQTEARHRSHSSGRNLRWDITFTNTARPQQPEVDYYSRLSDPYPYWNTDAADVTHPQQPEVGHHGRLGDYYPYWDTNAAGGTRPQQSAVGRHSRLSDRRVHRNTAFTGVTRSQQEEMGRRGRPSHDRLRGRTVFNGITHPQPSEVGRLHSLSDYALHSVYPPPRYREAHPNQINWGQQNSLYQQQAGAEPAPVQHDNHATFPEALDEGCPICGEEDAYKTYEAVRCTGCRGCICQLCYDRIRESACVSQDYDYHNNWAALFRTEFACPLCRKPF